MTIDPIGPVPESRIAHRLAAPRAMIISAGGLGALALGIGLGFAAKPDLGTASTPAPMRPVTASQPLSVEVNAPAPPAPVRPAGKLEVLPPDMAQAAAQTSRTYSN